MHNKTQLAHVGFTPALIAALLAVPDETRHHKRGLCHWVEHLYLDSRVEAAMRDPRFLALQAARRERERRAAVKRAAIPARYAGWRAALPDACAAMFSLNRYGKHAECGAAAKVEIYQLKNDLIEILWRKGYCTLSWVHRLAQEAQRCRECAGEGECDHCGGSGVWREARVLEFWCFRFLVAGTAYCWHQPRHLVEFAPDESVPPQDWAGIAGEKPVPLARARFADAKALVRWTLAAAAEDAPELLPESQPLPFDVPEWVADARVCAAGPMEMFT